MQVEHEVDEGAAEAGARPGEHGEARAGNLAGPLEVQDAQRRPDVPVRARLEVERGRLAVAAHLGVVGVGGPDGDARVREVREREGQPVALGLHLRELGLVLLDARAVGLALGHQRRHVLPAGPAAVAAAPAATAGLAGAGDALADLLPRPARPFQHREERAALGVEADQLRERAGRPRAARFEAGADVVEAFAKQGGIKHR